ncbi:unnamed protein product, partial [marine sediment metagenome]
RTTKIHPLIGWIMPLVMVGLLIFAIIETTNGLDFVKTSEGGPGSMYALLAVSLVVGLVVGFIFQRTRLCTVGAWRDVMLVRSTHLLSGIIAIIIGALVTNYIVGNFAADGIYNWGFTDQPIAHSEHLWNFLGMSLAGLAFTLAGACPLRNLILAGEGDADAGVFIIGLFAGAAFAHNFLLASSPAGIGANAPIAVGLGLAFCLIVGFFMRSKA